MTKSWSHIEELIKMILVVGASGMLGYDLMNTLEGDIRGVDLPEIDITSLESVRKVLLTLKPQIIINSAAYTDVDGCETEKETAMSVNGEGVAFLAMTAKEINAKLVHISSDYIFNGKKGSPYIEDDLPAPLNVYGESKLAGEMNAAIAPEYLIIRTQWLYGINGKNFVETMLSLAKEKKELSVVDDQIGSPTWTKDLSIAIKVLIDKNCTGIYHVTNSGFCSWNKFAKEIFRQQGVEITVTNMTTEELKRPAKRPLYSALDCSKLYKATGFKPETWQEALSKYLALRKGN